MINLKYFNEYLTYLTMNILINSSLYSSENYLSYIPTGLLCHYENMSHYNNMTEGKASQILKQIKLCFNARAGSVTNGNAE